MKVDLTQKITDLFGRPVPKTNASKEEWRELEKYPKVPTKFGMMALDTSYLPDETLGNFLLSCLTDYPSKDLRDHIMVVLLAGKLVEAKETIELEDKYVNFIVQVLDGVTQRNETKKVKEQGSDGKQVEVEKEIKTGTMLPWAVMKAKILLGIQIDK